MLMATAASLLLSAKPAQADWFSDMLASSLCTTSGSSEYYLGGSTTGIDEAFGGTTSKASNMGLPSNAGATSKGKPAGTWTALQQYGYMAPSFTYWVPAYSGDNSPVYVGTGGAGAGNETTNGTQVQIKTAQQSNGMYTDAVTGCTPIGKGAETGVANVIMWVPKAAVAITSTIYSVAQNISLDPKNPYFGGIATEVKTIISGDANHKGLLQSLYLQFLTPLIMIGACYLAWVGLVKRASMVAFQAAIWMLIAIIGGTWFLSNPLGLVNGLQGTTDKIDAYMSSVVISAEPQR